jgi:hypothetical protein
MYNYNLMVLLAPLFSHRENLLLFCVCLELLLFHCYMMKYGDRSVEMLALGWINSILVRELSNADTGLFL